MSQTNVKLFDKSNILNNLEPEPSPQQYILLQPQQPSPVSLGD